MPTLKKYLTTLIVIFSCAPLVAQSNTIKIKFIGNCGLYLTDDHLNLYIDFPYKSGFFNYMEYEKQALDSIKQNSIFLFTHKHPDHYSIKHMRKTLRKKKGHKYGKWNLDAMQHLSDTTANFSIEPIATEHSLSHQHHSYIITWHGKRIYISGDEESTEQVLALSNLDWAFLPYWIVEKLNKQDATVDSKLLGVYHFYPIMKVTNSNPEKIKILMQQGEIFYLPY